jgi:hypothetical protein
MKPELLVLIALRDDAHRRIAASYHVHHAPTAGRAARRSPHTAARYARC